jgi:ribosome-associated protein
MRSISEIISECKSELNFASARSSGPGGQHVNKTETKVILTWDIDSSSSLSDNQKEIVKKKLSRYINKEGVLSLYDQSTRYQLRNKVKVIAKWTDLLRQALTPAKKRKPTKPTQSSIKKRLKSKQKRSEKKQHRKKIRFPE